MKNYCIIQFVLKTTDLTLSILEMTWLIFWKYDYKFYKTTIFHTAIWIIHDTAILEYCYSAI
jgi:hypothetical protein